MSIDKNFLFIYNSDFIYDFKVKGDGVFFGVKRECLPPPPPQSD